MSSASERQKAAMSLPAVTRELRGLVSEQHRGPARGCGCADATAASSPVNGLRVSTGPRVANCTER